MDQLEQMINWIFLSKELRHPPPQEVVLKNTLNMHVYLLPGLVTTNHLQFESGAEYQIPFGGKRHLCLEKVIFVVGLIYPQ